MQDSLDSWRLAAPPPRVLFPSALAAETERRAALRRRRAGAALALCCALVTLGAGIGLIRADRVNLAALDTLRDAHLAELGAEVDS